MSTRERQAPESENVPELSTGWYRGVRDYPRHVWPIAISRHVPGWYHPARLTIRRDLAPTRHLLGLARRIDREQWALRFAGQLERLGLDVVLLAAPRPAVLLCWEAPGVFCHRRLVAEWIEARTGLVIPELGFDRQATGQARDLPEEERPDGEGSGMHP